MSESSASCSHSQSQSHSRSRSRRSVPTPAPAVRGWIPSNSVNQLPTVSFDDGVFEDSGLSGQTAFTSQIHARQGGHHDESASGTRKAKGKEKEKEREEEVQKTGYDGAEKRLSSLYHIASGAEPLTTGASTGAGGGSGGKWGVAGFMNAAFGVTAYRYLSGGQTANLAVSNVAPEIVSERPAGSTITEPSNPCTADLQAALQEAVSTPTKPPPPALRSNQPSPSSSSDTGPFEWSTLHRDDRYRPPCRSSRLSNISHGSTLSSAFSYEPMTPDTPRTFALPSLIAKSARTIIDEEESPTKLPLLRHRLARGRIPEMGSQIKGGKDVGLGLDLNLGIDEEEAELNPDSDPDLDLDPEGLSGILDRLDCMLEEIQTLTERGQSALETTAI